MARQHYSRNHYRRLSNGGPDTPEAVAWRFRDNEARRSAVADREARYPELTPENFQEAMAFQQERIAFHHARLSGA